MSEDGFSDCLDEPSMEIQIDTLMGTSFDMRVSSTDTIREIKQRIQRVEGIPIHQQNLIFQSKELKDSRRLCDVGVKNGSIIRLIVAMKGGPISTRRLSVSCEHHLMLKELKELLETTRDEIGDKLAPGSKVSVLVFKEGDILNLLRVIENEDGSYSPYEKPISPPKPHLKDAVFEKLAEDTDMMAKITNLRKKMENVSLKRQLRQKPESSDNKPTYKLLSDCGSDLLDLKIFEKSEEEVALKDKHRSRTHKPTLYSENKGAMSHTKQNYARIHKKTRELPKEDVCVLTRLSPPDTIELEENVQDLWEIHEPVSERLKHSATCKVGVLKRRQSLDYSFEGIDNPPKPEIGGELVCSGNLYIPSAIPPQYAPKECDFYYNSPSPLYGRKVETDDIKSNFRCSNIERLRNDEESIDYGYYNLGCSAELEKKHKKLELPPVIKKKSRCSECNRKLNITNIYDCRCGKIFCSQHRYSEVHRCTYDYKTEGKRILEHQNPLVAAEKVHRI